MLGMKKMFSRRKLNVSKHGDDADDDSDKSQPIEAIHSDSAEPDKGDAEKWGEWSDEFSRNASDLDEDEFVPLNDDSAGKTTTNMNDDDSFSSGEYKAPTKPQSLFLRPTLVTAQSEYFNASKDDSALPALRTRSNSDPDLKKLDDDDSKDKKKKKKKKSSSISSGKKDDGKKKTKSKSDTFRDLKSFKKEFDTVSEGIESKGSEGSSTRGEESSTASAKLKKKKSSRNLLSESSHRKSSKDMLASGSSHTRRKKKLKDVEEQKKIRKKSKEQGKDIDEMSFGSESSSIVSGKSAKSTKSQKTPSTPGSATSKKKRKSKRLSKDLPDMPGMPSSEARELEQLDPDGVIATPVEFEERATFDDAWDSPDADSSKASKRSSRSKSPRPNRTKSKSPKPRKKSSGKIKVPSSGSLAVEKDQPLEQNGGLDGLAPPSFTIETAAPPTTKSKEKPEKSKEKNAKEKPRKSKSATLLSLAVKSSKEKRSSGPSSQIVPAGATSGDNDGQRAEILRLQHQLSEALQKVVSTTEEHINDKGKFLEVSSEVTRLKSDLGVLERERDDLKEKLSERETVVKTSMERIDKLEGAIEKQLDSQDALELKLERSEDEIEKLLIEIQDLETNMEKAKTGDLDSLALTKDLKEAEKNVAEKEKEVKECQERITFLESELQNAATVNKLQVDELENENKALKGKLQAEKLDSTSKISKRDEIISNLQTELNRYKFDKEWQDLAAIKENLESAKADLTLAQEEKEAAERTMNKAKEEKEDLLERNNVLNEKIKILQKNNNELTDKSEDLGKKVLQWTERTYDWKNKAESAENELKSYKEENDMGDSEVVDNGPQGLFLQAAMDKRETMAKKGVWNLFGGKGADGEDESPEQIRIKTLEERNTSLEETIAELRSEMVKMKTSYQEEAYTTQKKLAQLQGENDALTLKNLTLEQVCNSESGNADPTNQ